MGKEAPSLQYDLFSGELIDNRTRTQKRRDSQREQPQQIDLFPQHELAQFGLSGHPKMDFDARAPLELSLQDVRTEEEKERDLQRAAEAATFSLFEATPMPKIQMDTVSDDTHQDDEPLPMWLAGLEPTDKISAYLSLVKATEERALTTWIDPKYSGAFLAELGLALAVAQQSGLLEAEIKAALKVGEYRGRHPTNV